MSTRILRISGVTLFLLAFLAAPVQADSLYQGIIRITKTGATAYNVAVPFTLNGQGLIDTGLVQSDFSDMTVTVEGTGDVPFMPGSNSTNPFMIFVPEIGPAAIDRHLQTGGADSGKIVYFPDTAGMSVPDDATLEWGGEGGCAITDYFNPASTGYHVNKAG